MDQVPFGGSIDQVIVRFHLEVVPADRLGVLLSGSVGVSLPFVDTHAFEYQLVEAGEAFVVASPTCSIRSRLRVLPTGEG